MGNVCCAVLGSHIAWCRVGIGDHTDLGESMSVVALRVGSTHVAHHVNHTIPHYHAEEVGTRTRPVSGSTRAIAVIETTT